MKNSPIPKPKLGEPYLLTPGPLTTSYEVKEAMLRDWGSWDADFRRDRQFELASAHGLVRSEQVAASECGILFGSPPR